MRADKRPDLEALVLDLIRHKSEITVHDVAAASGLSKSNEADRKAIRRALHALAKRGLLKPEGAARARVYVRSSHESDVPSTVARSSDFFKKIKLSPSSQTLLQYLVQPLGARRPIGYNQDFLQAYEPNKSHYLNAQQRAEMLAFGRVETVIRPAGTYARNILDRLLIDLSWNSSRIEGNTYSLLETKRLIEFGELASGKDATEAQMILGHKAAIEYIVESATESSITAHDVYSIHALLSENLLGDPSASGRIRRIAVGIGGSTYLPLENHYKLKEYLNLIIDKMNAIRDPFEQSFFSLVHLSYLQAFEDVNKRTARIIANIPLVKDNLKPLSFVDVDRETYVMSLLGIYERSDVSLFRDLYLWAYQRSAQKYSAIQHAIGEPDLLKLKYRNAIHEIVRTIILEQVAGRKVVARIKDLIASRHVPALDAEQIFGVIELEIASLHDGNIARFKIRPSEYLAWKAKDAD